MTRRSIENRHLRTLIKGTSSYLVTIPVEYIRMLKWRDNQKLVAEIDEKQGRVIIRDWKKSDGQ